MPDPTSDPALNGPWSIYRTWARTAAYEKGKLDWLTRQSLWLAIAGAVVATLGQQLAPGAPKDGAFLILHKVLGVVGAGAVALAAYLSRQALGNDRVSLWTRARTAAESLKSLIYLYRASVPPFDGPDRTKQLISRVEAVVGELKGLEARPQDNKPVPPAGLTVDQYLSERVNDQINWYETRASKHQRQADLCRTVTAILGGIGALLALGTAVASISAWAAVIATVTASITAHMKNQQYQLLTTTYRATAMRLRLLASEWSGSGKADADKAERNLFIQRCEDTMAAENGAWSALWTKKDDTPVASKQTGGQ
jgi:hypothetical protein